MARTLMRQRQSWGPGARRLGLILSVLGLGAAMLWNTSVNGPRAQRAPAATGAAPTQQGGEAGARRGRRLYSAGSA